MDISIKIKGVDFTTDEARQIYKELDGLFGVNPVVPWSPPVFPSPNYTPLTPIYPTSPFYLTSGPEPVITFGGKNQ